MPLDTEPGDNRSAQRDENLDVVRTSRDQESLEPQAWRVIPVLLRTYLVVCPSPGQPVSQRNHRGRYRPRGSKSISVQQAANILEAVKFAKSIGVPLVAHLTLHWSGTVAFDDPDGTRFASIREGLSKVLLRRGIPPAWIWCRECKAHTDVVHCHLLFHLPAEYRTGAKRDEIEAHLERLVDRHGDAILGEFAVRLQVWPDPDGLYLIKGGGPKVWKLFPRIRQKWRTSQGVVYGKRCGTSQSIGPAARLRALMQTTASTPAITGQ